MPNNPIASNHIINADSPQAINMESQLDVQVINYANNAETMWYWNTDGWIYQWTVNFCNASDRPEVVSLSWASHERQTCNFPN